MAIIKNRTDGSARTENSTSHSFILRVDGYISGSEETLVSGKRADTGEIVVVGMSAAEAGDAQRKTIEDVRTQGNLQVRAGGLLRVDRAKPGEVYRARYVRPLKRDKEDFDNHAIQITAKPALFISDQSKSASIYAMEKKPAGVAGTVAELEEMVIFFSQKENSHPWTEHHGATPIVYVREKGTSYIDPLNVGYPGVRNGCHVEPTSEEIKARLWKKELWTRLISNANKQGVFVDPSSKGLEVVAGFRMDVGKKTTYSNNFKSTASLYKLDVGSKAFQLYQQGCEQAGVPVNEYIDGYRPSIIGIRVERRGSGHRIFATSLQPMAQYPKTINGTEMDLRVMGVESHAVNSENPAISEGVSSQPLQPPAVQKAEVPPSVGAQLMELTSAQTGKNQSLEQMASEGLSDYPEYESQPMG